MLCSVVKHAGSGRARKKCRGKHETQSSVFPHFLSALPLPKCLYSLVGRWPIDCYSCPLFNFALIEFSLKRFLSFFILIALCPSASSRFGTLAEFCTVAEYSFGSLADC